MMLNKFCVRKHQLSSLLVGLILTSLLFRTVDAQPTCTLDTTAIGGGAVSAIATAAVDPQLGVSIAPDLSQVVLENSEMRIEYKPFFADHDQFAIRNLFFKTQGNEDQVCCGEHRYLEADAFRGPLVSATIVEQRADRITVRFVWNDRLNNPSNTITHEHTIFANSRFLKIDYLDVRNGINVTDIGHPGRTSNGIHWAYGGDSWIRGYVTQEYEPTQGGYYNRYSPDGVFDPVDGGSLSYNGHFIMAVYNPANGRGFGRVLPVTSTEIVKLLLSEGLRNGLEFFPYPFFNPHSPFTGYLYILSGGATEALSKGQQLADGNVEASLSCGEETLLAALPYTGYNFDGWSGDLTVTTTPETLLLTGNHSVTANFSPLPALHYLDFEAYPDSSDPVYWRDTAANNSMSEDPALFKTFESGGERFFGSSSTATNIHSHYDAPGSSSLSEYEYSGRMRITRSTGGIGVTVLSQYPNTDVYYRLRRQLSGSFHLSHHGASLAGTTDTGVIPVTDQWYRFLMRVGDAGTRTEIRAKIWKDGTPEPGNWQIDAYDDTPNRLTEGTFGVWSFHEGRKDFDDLTIRLLDPPATDLVLTLSQTGNGTLTVNPDKPVYTSGDEIDLEAFPDPGWFFMGWGGDLSGSENPVSLTIDSDLNITAAFAPITLHTLNITPIGNGTVSVDPVRGTYDIGQEVTLTANPGPDFAFKSWGGDLIGNENPATYTIFDDTNITATFSESTVVYSEDFEPYADGDDPDNWLDTGPNRSLGENASLFKVFDISEERFFGTTSTETNIHSHYVGQAAAALANYELSGRMRVTDADGGIGITVLSQYPSGDAYYRLRRYFDTSFQLHPWGTTVTGDVDSGVVPSPGTWYRFRLQVEDSGSTTLIRANVWPDGTPEPSGWQIDAADSSSSRLTEGSFGVWTFHKGRKDFDDFRVKLLAPPLSDLTLTVDVIGSGTVDVSPSQNEYTVGDEVTLTALPGVDQTFTGWGKALSGFTNPVTLVMTNDEIVEANFAPATSSIQQDFEGLGAGESPPDWFSTGANNSMQEDTSQFQVSDVGGERFLSNNNTASNVHIHYNAPGSELLTEYEYSGRMRITNPAGGIGVTFLSQYPVSDNYYRLRRYFNTSFRLSPHGTGPLTGIIDSAVVPVPNVWYRFRILTEDTGTHTVIRARIWPDGSEEPLVWQIDAQDSSATRLSAGTFGMWSFHLGRKDLDDVQVAPLP